MKLGLIISNDWELFGDGSGDFYKDQYEPTRELLKICEDYEAKLTLMAEVGQQWAHQKISQTEKWAFDIVNLWENQLKDTIKRKHDVQLHLHPQWIGDINFINGKWVLDNDYSTFSNLSQTKQEDILREGKEYLERLLRPATHQYSCVGFRAGGTRIEPYKNIVQSLLNIGILSDTSLTKGLFDYKYYDYRKVHSNYRPWFVDHSDIRIQGKTNNGLLEIPISSVPIIDSPILRKTFFPGLVFRYNFGVKLSKHEKNLIRTRNQKSLRRYSLLQRPNVRENITNIKWIASQIVARTNLQLDYVALPANIFINILCRLLDEIEQKPSLEKISDKECIFPIMSFGHVKSMMTCDNFHDILEKIKSQLHEKIVFWTFREAIDYWISHFKDGGE